MRIPRRLILDPDANAVFAVPAVALSLFVFAYSTNFGPLSILVFYALWLPPLAVAPGLLLRGILRVLPLLVLPAAAALSTLWSDNPDQTLRAAIQYGTTVLCGLVAARLVSVPALSLGGVLGSLGVLLYSFANGSFAFDVVDGSYAFAGAFSSKNQLGYFASLALIFATGVLLVFRATPVWRLLAAGVAGLALLTLARADSATSILTVAGALAVLGGARVLFALAPAQRSLAAMIVAAAALAGLIVAWSLGVFAQLLGAFGKDATLTGRTYLWSEGLRIGSENPILGLGYSAFWSDGRPAAEELWRQFYITGRTGFHFHNTLIEAYVGLGILGVALALGLTFGLIALAARALMSRHRAGSAMLCAGLAALFVVRSAVEIDFLTPYAAGSFLVPFILLRMADQRAAERALSHGPRSASSGPRPPLPSVGRPVPGRRG